MKFKALKFIVFLALCFVCLSKAGFSYAYAIKMNAETDSSGTITNVSAFHINAVWPNYFYPPVWYNGALFYVDANGNQTYHGGNFPCGDLGLACYCSYIAPKCDRGFDTTDTLHAALSYFGGNSGGHTDSMAGVLGWYGDSTHWVGDWYIFYELPNQHCTTLDSCLENADSYIQFTQTSTYPAQTWNAPPTAPTLTITAPNNNSTVTDNAMTLNGSWFLIDHLAYGYLRLWFQNPNNGIYSDTYTITLTANNGTFQIPFSAFNIKENGNWVLHANAEHDANLFMDFTPDPAYTLTFNVSGNTIPYAFTNWNTWYTTNAAGGYSAPSDFANSIEGFFQPIFTNAYEFANNTLAYFNASTAYDKGDQIGLVFPTTQAYLNKINVFFGGFPLIQFFEFLIIVMLGIFIIRTIFKFIPFFG